MKLSEHFDDSEFRCKCGRRADGPYCSGLPENGMNPELIALLEQIRERLGVPIVVYSGYRCHRYNESVGGARSSQHLLGNAADIAAKDISPSELRKTINRLVKGGMGAYPTFTHVDVRRNRARWQG